MITKSFAVTAAAVLLAHAAQADDGTWTKLTSGNATGIWSDADTSNWFGGTVADGGSFTANFNTLNITATSTISLGESRLIGNLIFSDTTTSSSANWILDNEGDGARILTLGGTQPTITVNTLGSGASVTISAEVSGINGLTKEGAGTLALTGTNTYTGTTTVNAGILSLGSGGSVASGSALAVGVSGTFDFSGAAAATQAVNGLNVNAGLGTVQNSVSGTTLTLNGITRSGGGMVDFATTTGNINTSTANNASGILGSWAFIGTGTTLDYAVSGGAGVAISSLGAIAPLPDAGPGGAAIHYTLAAAQTQTADTVGNTLRYTDVANTLALGTTSLGLNGLMNAGTGTLTITGTAGNPGLVTTGELDIASNGQAITISSVISGAGSVVYGGPGAGTLTLSGVNTYDGGTTINQGVLFAKSNSALGNTSGAVTVVSGARLQLQNVNIANAVNLNGGIALRADGGGNNTLSGVVTLQSNASWSANNNGNNSTTFNNAVALGDFVFSISTAGTNNNATISGTLTGSSTSGISKTGNGPLTLSGDGTGYSGTTTFSSGEIYLGSDTALGTGSLAIRPPNDGSLTIRSNNATDRSSPVVITLPQSINNGNSSGRFIFGSASTGSLTFTNTTAINLGTATRRFEVFNRTQFDAGFAGGSGITMQTGTGTLVLNGDNTYSGATTINAGTLNLMGSTVGSVIVNPAGTLSGTGTVGGSVTGTGTIAPGNGGIGTLNTSDTVNFTGNLIMEVNGVTSDKLLSTSDINLEGATLTVNEIGAFTGPYVIAEGANVTGTMIVPSGYFVNIVDGNKAVLTLSGAPANFADWANANGVTGGVNGDSDKDGIVNGAEYGLNTNPAGSDGTPGTYIGNLLSFNKRVATSGNSDLSYRIEISSDLGITVPWAEVGAYVQNESSIISATIPNGPTKNFARLRVVVNP